jgi:hypothetical protein
MEGVKGANGPLNDDFRHLPWQMSPSERRASDTSLPMPEVLESLDWLRCLDPGALRDLMDRGKPAPVGTEDHAVLFLVDLLDFAGLRRDARGHLAVNWGDGSPVECFGPDREPFDPGHLHCFTSSGQFKVLLGVCSPCSPPVLIRLLALVDHGSGEATVMHPAGLE